MNNKVQQIRPTTPEAEMVKALIDDYGEACRRKALAQPDLDLAKDLKEKIELLAADRAADLPFTIAGHRYQLQFSARRRERTLTDKRKAFNALKKALGMDGLIAVIDIPFGAAIDKHIPESLRKTFVTEEKSGYRTVDVVALAPAAGERAA